ELCVERRRLVLEIDPRLLRRFAEEKAVTGQRLLLRDGGFVRSLVIVSERQHRPDQHSQEGGERNLFDGRGHICGFLVVLFHGRRTYCGRRDVPRPCLKPSGVTQRVWYVFPSFTHRRSTRVPSLLPGRRPLL